MSKLLIIYKCGMIFLLMFFFACSTIPEKDEGIRQRTEPITPELKENLGEIKREKIKKLAENILEKLNSLSGGRKLQYGLLKKVGVKPENEEISHFINGIWYESDIRIVIFYPVDFRTGKVNQCGKSLFFDLDNDLGELFQNFYGIRIVNRSREAAEEISQEIYYQNTTGFDRTKVIKIGRKVGANVALASHFRGSAPKELELVAKLIGIETDEKIPEPNGILIPMDFTLEESCFQAGKPCTRLKQTFFMPAKPNTNKYDIERKARLKMLKYLNSKTFVDIDEDILIEWRSWVIDPRHWSMSSHYDQHKGGFHTNVKYERCP